MKKRYARILAATLSAAMVFTSAPTAAFATEFDVVDEVVDDEGVATATKAEVDALFPSNNLVVAFGTAVIKDMDTATTAGDYTSATTVNPASYETGSGVGSAVLNQLTVGETATLKLIADVTAVACDFSGIGAAFNATYEEKGGKRLVTREITVKCIKAQYTATTIVDAFAGGTVKATYGATEAADITYTSADAKWTVKSIAPATTKAVKDDIVKAGAVLTTATVGVLANQYDMAARAATLNSGLADKPYSYNEVTRCFEYVTDVTIVEKDIASTTLVWPTSLAAGVVATVGDDATKLKLASVKEQGGTFTVKTVAGAGTITTAGTNQAVIMTFTADDNHTVDSGASVDSAALFNIEVAKKEILDNELVPYMTMAEKKVPAASYGMTYDQWLTNVNGEAQNAYLDYAFVDSTLGSKVMTAGTKTVTLKATVDPGVAANYQLKNGKAYKEVTVTFEVEESGVKSAMQADVNSGGAATAQKAYSLEHDSDTLDLIASMDFNGLTTTGATVKYQWYKDGVAVSGAAGKTATLSVENATVTELGKSVYKCEMTVDTTGMSAGTAKDTLESIVKDVKFTTDEVAVVITKLTGVALDSNTAALSSGITYGYEDILVDVDYTLGSNTLKSLKAKIVDADGKETAIDKARIIAGAGGGQYGIYLPNGLQASTVDSMDNEKEDYSLVVELETTTSDGKVDNALISLDFKVLRDTLTVPTINAEKTSYEYGTKATDIKLLVGSDNKEYDKGTLTVKTVNNIVYPNAAAAAQLDVSFEPNADTKRNYKLASGWATAKTTNSVAITAKELVVKADDVTIKLGDELPNIKSLQKAYKVEGLVGDDKAEDIIESVELKYDGDLSSDIKKVGTIKDGIICLASAYAGVTNYTVNGVEGNVVVTDGTAVKPSTAPTVAPTAAKVAATANAKAVKATVTAKVGASKTTQVKMTAAAKAQIKSVKWTTSNKKVAKLPKSVSKKALKVKVKGLKKGKATIKAKVTFKDGSTKTIKFTVKVK